jgi:hypothetical protein
MAEYTKTRGDTWIFDLPLTRLNAQTITIEGTPTNGTFTIAYTSQDGSTETTYGIAHNAVAADVETALETLPNVAASDVTVTGGPGPGTPWVVTINTVGAYVLSVTGTFTGGSGVNIHVEPAAFDLTGASVYATFKQNKGLADDGDGVFQYSWIAGVADGITVATPATGVAVLTITDTDSATYLTNNAYYYDIQVTDSTGETVTVDDGTLRVTEDVTRTVA